MKNTHNPHSMEKMLPAVGASVLLTITFLVPVSAFAYLSPDQVFGGSSLTVAPASTTATQTKQTSTAQTTQTTQSQTAQQIPEQINLRNAESVVSIQQQNAATLRAEAQQSLTSTQAEPVDTFVAPAQQNNGLGLFDQNQNYAKRLDRIQAQRANAPTIIIGGNGDVIDANGNVLHSGAPLVTQTGPETTLAFVAMLLAAACTFAYAQIRSRRQIAA